MHSSGICILGASGHGKVVLGILRALSLDVAGFYDDAPSLHGASVMGIPVLGSLTEFSLVERGAAVSGIGNGAIRRRIVAMCTKALWTTLVHPAAWVDPAASLDSGTVICAGAVLQPGVSVGCHAIVNTCASVDHDCLIGDFTHVCPGVHLGGNVHVGQDSWIGIGSQVIQGVRIGSNVLAGAGSTVIRDVPDNAVVMGTPARIVRYQS